MRQFRTTALPYPYRSEGLDFEIDEFVVDGERTVAVGDDNRRVPVAPTDPQRKVVLRGELDLPEEVVTTVFPEPERDSPPGKLYVAVRSLDTMLRDRVDVASTDLEAGRYDVTVRLPRAEVHGDVQLVPFLTRTRGLPSSDVDTPCATTAGVRLASAPTWTVRMDDPRDGSEDAIDGEQASFSEHDHLPSGDHLYYVDFRNAGRPKLWLNSDHGRIVEILHGSGTMGTRARMRDVILDHIQHATWTQLLVRAIADADPETGEPRHDWQETVLEMFATDLTDHDETAQAAVELTRRLADPDDVPFLTEAIDEVVQSHVDPREQFINLIEEGLYL